jgi:hypothetical protein
MVKWVEVATCKQFGGHMNIELVAVGIEVIVAVKAGLQGWCCNGSVTRRRRDGSDSDSKIITLSLARLMDISRPGLTRVGSVMGFFFVYRDSFGFLGHLPVDLTHPNFEHYTLKRISPLAHGCRFKLLAVRPSTDRRKLSKN